MAKIKHKKRLLKASRKKQQVMYKWTHIRLSADFSAATLQARWEWHDIFKVMKGKTYNLPNKAFIQIWRRYQKFYRKAKVKRV